ncbi:MAG: oligosaccharide flippase family protein [Bacteroidales bacterium]|nr:oligosaccharide flippase family protein [Bacteroidales bacterium]
MLDHLRNTVKHTAIYSLGNLSTKIIGLILLPLYTTHLTTAEYGIFSILEVTSQFFTTIVSLGLTAGMMRWFAAEQNEDRRKMIVFTTFAATLTLAVIVNVAFYPFNSWFSNLFFDHGNFSDYFLILWLWVALEAINRVPFELFRLKEKSLLFISLVILKFVTILLLNIYFIVILKMGVKGIILSQLLGNVLVTMGTFPFLLKNMRFSFNMTMLKELSLFSIPLVLSTVATMALALSDRYLIKYFLDYSQVGIYSVGYKVASVIHLFMVQSFLLGFAPLAYKIFDQPEARRYFARVTTYFTYAMTGLALILIFYAKEVIAVFAASNDEYLLAYNVIPMLCLAVIFRGLNSVISMGLHYVKKTKYTIVIVLIVAVFNIGINLLMIPMFGIQGAAVASVLANLMMTIMFYIYSQRYYPINYEFARILKLLLSGVAIYFVASLTASLGFWTGIGVKTMLLLIFPLLLFAIKFYEPVELNSLRGAWLKWRNPARWADHLKHFGTVNPLNTEDKNE